MSNAGWIPVPMLPNAPSTVPASTPMRRPQPHVRSPLPGLLSLVGEAIGAGRHHRSALEAEITIIDCLRDRQALIVVDEAHHLRDKLLDELRIIRDRADCGLALVADETIRMALARCHQVDGRIGLKIDLATQPSADVEDIAAGVLGRRPSKAELKTLNAVGKASMRCADCWAAHGWWRRRRTGMRLRKATSPPQTMKAQPLTKARRRRELADASRRPGAASP